MTDEEKQIGRIKAVLGASEEVIKRAKNDKGTVLMAKETAYDHILGITEDADFCPWME